MAVPPIETQSRFTPFFFLCIIIFYKKKSPARATRPSCSIVSIPFLSSSIFSPFTKPKHPIIVIADETTGSILCSGYRDRFLEREPTHSDDLDELSGNLSLTSSVVLQVQLSDHIGGVYKGRAKVCQRPRYVLILDESGEVTHFQKLRDTGTLGNERETRLGSAVITTIKLARRPYRCPWRSSSRSAQRRDPRQEPSKGRWPRRTRRYRR